MVSDGPQGPVSIVNTAHIPVQFFTSQHDVGGHNLRSASGPVKEEVEAEHPWSTQAWSWEPFKLVATPVERELETERSSITTDEKTALLTQVGAAAVRSMGFTQQDQLRGRLGSFEGQDGEYGRGPKGKGPPTCQVDSCCADLTALKDYHQRYKICEYHLKVNSIMRDGRSQRFCQQCGRFHNLTEFDADKRSCRARLQRHNARRRKKTDSESGRGLRKTSRKAGSSVSKDEESAMLSSLEQPPSSRQKLSQPQGSSSSYEGDTEGLDWAQPTSISDMSLEGALSELLQDNSARHNTAPVSLEAIQEFLGDTRSYRESALLPGLAEQVPLRSMLHEPLHLPPNHLPHLSHQAFDSMPPERTSYRHPDEAAMGPPPAVAVPHMGYDGMNGMPPVTYPYTGPMLDPYAAPKPPCGGTGDYSGGAAAPQMYDQLMGMSSTPQAGSYEQEQQLLAMQRGMGGADLMSASAGMQALNPQLYPMASDRYDSYNLSGQSSSTGYMQSPPVDSLAAAVQLPAAAGKPMSVLDEARALLNYSASPYQQQYVAEQQLTRVSAKLFNCTPSALPPDLKQNLLGLLNCGVNGLEGYIRPGCVHLTLNALLDSEQCAGLGQMGVRRAVEQLVAARGGEFWTPETVLVQLFDEVALVRNGQVLHVLSTSGSKGVFPQVEALSPCCVLGAAPDTVTLRGRNIRTPDNFVLCRCHGLYVPAKLIGQQAGEEQDIEMEDAEIGARVAAGGGGGEEVIQLRLPPGQRTGAVHVEIARGGFLSRAKPLLVLDDAQAVAEVRCLEEAALPGIDLDALLLDLDRVVEFNNQLRLAQLGPAGPAAIPVKEYSAEELKQLAVVARKLLLFAADKGWPGVTRMILPAAAADCESVEQVVASLNIAVGRGGLTLLHRAVRSQSIELVRLLVQWGRSDGFEWRAAIAGPRGITPPHLAAILPDGGAMADALTDLCSDGAPAWTTARAADGTTPSDFVKMIGDLAIDMKIRDKPAKVLQAAQAALGVAEARRMVGAELKKAGGSTSDPASVLDSLTSIDTLPASPSAARPEPATSSSGSTEYAVEAGGVAEGLRQRPAAAAAAAAGAALQEEGAMCPSRTAQAKHEHVPQQGAKGGRAKEVQYGFYEDYYCEGELFGVKVAPTVFDRTSALFSAGLIAAIGEVTLFLRYYVDAFLG